MRSLIFFYILALCGQPVLARGATIYGKLSANGAPLPYAAAFLQGTSLGTRTDEKGNFIITDIPAGSYTLQLAATGHVRQVKNIHLKEGERLEVNAELEPLQQREVVISGTLKESYVDSSPVKIDVYTPMLFRKNPSPSIFESLQMVNGVQPQVNCNVCNTGDIHINGMEGPYTMITIDGMPIVSALSTVYGLNGIPNSLIQRMEVVKGPASTLYGSEAVGGLINIITKKPETAPKLSVDIFGTSQGELNTDIGLSRKIGKAHSLLGINYFVFNNRIDGNGDNFTDVALQNRISVFNKWSFQRGKNRQATIAARFFYEDRWGGELQWAPVYRGGDSVYGESVYTTRLELLGNYELPIEKEKLKFQYSYNYHHQNSAYGEVLYIATQQVAFGQLLWDKRKGRHDLLAGLPVRFTYYDDNTSATAGADSLQPQNKPQNTFLPGIFVQDEIVLNPRLHALAGLRYDWHSTHGNIFSPRLNMKYSPNTDNTFRAGIGNGYRVVNLFTEDHAALTGARQVEIKHELKPERSWNLSLNYTRYISFKKGFIMVDGGAFYTYFTNKIVGDFLTDPSKIIYDNLQGYAISKGLNCNLEVSLTNGIKATAGGTLMNVYQVEENLNGEPGKVPQLFAPVFSGNYSFSFPLNRLGMSVDITGKLNGPMYLPVLPNDYRPERSPWYTIANLQLTKKLKKGPEIYAGVKNLLNFIPEFPLMRPFDPFNKNVADNNPNGYTFDTSYNYASLQGIRGFLGFLMAF